MANKKVTLTLPTNRTEPPLGLALPARRDWGRDSRDWSGCWCRSRCGRSFSSRRGSRTISTLSTLRWSSGTLRAFGSGSGLGSGSGFRLSGLGLRFCGDDRAAGAELDHIDGARPARDKVAAGEEDNLGGG